jgi:hypothetical protein
MAERNLIQRPELLLRLARSLGMRQSHVSPTLNEGVQPVIIVDDMTTGTRIDPFQTCMGWGGPVGGDGLGGFAQALLHNPTTGSLIAAPVGRSSNVRVRLRRVIVSHETGGNGRARISCTVINGLHVLIGAGWSAGSKTFADASVAQSATLPERQPSAAVLFRQDASLIPTAAFHLSFQINVGDMVDIPMPDVYLNPGNSFRVISEEAGGKNTDELFTVFVWDEIPLDNSPGG